MRCTNPAIIISAQLGSGAFSTVRSGTHKRAPAQKFAVKCVQRSKLKEEDIVALKDEVAILSALHGCSHIIRLYDFFDEKDTFFLVMETMAGGELFDRIVAKSYYNEKEARDTCKILLEAVDYCHRHRVAHRDLKVGRLLCGLAYADGAAAILSLPFVFHASRRICCCGARRTTRRSKSRTSASPRW